MAGNGHYLYVRNWSQFQHYKHRSPPWIKLHRSLLSDYEFQRLPDTAKAHLILIWLYAAEHDGAIPADELYLRRRLGLTSTPNLKLLIKQGFLVENASISLASCKQSAILETETEKRRDRVEADGKGDSPTRSSLKTPSLEKGSAKQLATALAAKFTQKARA